MPIYTDPAYFDIPELAITGTNAFKNKRDNYFQQAFQQIGITLGSGSAMPTHHIIPLAMIRGTGTNPLLTNMLIALTNAGLFSILDGHQNLVWLPTASSGANIPGLALHGSHSTCNSQVMAALKQIAVAAFQGADPANATYEG